MTNAQIHKFYVVICIRIFCSHYWKFFCILLQHSAYSPRWTEALFKQKNIMSAYVHIYMHMYIYVHINFCSRHHRYAALWILPNFKSTVYKNTEKAACLQGCLSVCTYFETFDNALASWVDGGRKLNKQRNGNRKGKQTEAKLRKSELRWEKSVSDPMFHRARGAADSSAPQFSDQMSEMTPPQTEQHIVEAGFWWN